MKRFLILPLLVCLCAITANAQYTISGKVTEKSDGAAIELATVQLLNKDSSFVNGVNSQKNGTFSLNVKKAGSYLVKVSFVGYNAVYRSAVVNKNNPAAKLGTISLGTNEVALKEAVITAKAAKVEMKADTFQYNASAYRVLWGRHSKISWSNCRVLR